jgi:uncharacterized protein with PIN domain
MGYIWARGFIRGHEKKDNPKKIKKVSDKQKSRIIANKSYYAQEIARHIEENNGSCPCENCNVEIINPTGSNVSHIIAGSANSALYHHPLNRFILCHECERIWTNEDKTKLKIYQSSEERMIDLKNFYYTTMVV